MIKYKNKIKIANLQKTRRLKIANLEKTNRINNL
jgi:hypothetical protein